MSGTALVVRGGWEGHRPVETTELFLPFLREAGFEVRVEDSNEVYAERSVMDAVDLVVQSVSMGRISREASAGLRRAVRSGTGLAGWHGGIVDSYRDDPEYVLMVGGQFATHPGKAPGDRTGDDTDSFVAHEIVPTDLGRAHGILAGIEPFDLVTEQYWVMHDDLIDVLATTTHPVRPHEPWQRPVVSPAVWTRRWGAGRVFVCTPGHDPDVLRHPSVRTIVERGMRWAARS